MGWPSSGVAEREQWRSSCGGGGGGRAWQRVVSERGGPAERMVRGRGVAGPRLRGVESRGGAGLGTGRVAWVRGVGGDGWGIRAVER